MLKKILNCFIYAVSVVLVLTSCGGKGGDNPPPDPCAGKTIVVQATATPTSNPTSANGAIIVSATGSTGFTYSINTTFQSGTSFTNLAAGSYTVTAKDADGCVGRTTVVVNATACPTVLVTATVTPASNATATNGSIVATAAGSTGFTYSRDNFATSQATGTFSNLAAGTYSIAAKDANGCIGTASFTVSIAACPTITITSTNVQPTGPTATNGSISIAAAGGVTAYTFSRDNGATFQASNQFTNLGPASYTVIAKDANGCQGSLVVNLTANCATLTVSSTVVNADKCNNNDGSIAVNVTNPGTYTYSRDGVTFQASNIFMNLAQNPYSLTVKDASGCTTPVSATVGQKPAGPTFTAVKSLLAANCAGCHSWATVDCDIVGRKNVINNRAVNGTPSPMPQSGLLPAAERQKITNWINAGGRHSD